MDLFQSTYLRVVVGVGVLDVVIVGCVKVEAQIGRGQVVVEGIHREKIESTGRARRDRERHVLAGGRLRTN